MCSCLGCSPILQNVEARGLRTLRFSYAGATEDIEEGLLRLEKFMARRGALVD